MPTACHNEDLSDASWKLYFYKDSNIFFCYTEDGAMNAFKFLENYYMARDIKFNWYKDVFLVIKDCSNYRGDFEQAEVYRGIGDKYKKNDNAVTAADATAEKHTVFNIQCAYVAATPAEVAAGAEETGRTIFWM